jgi:hypothetical protein
VHSSNSSTPQRTRLWQHPAPVTQGHTWPESPAVWSPKDRHANRQRTSCATGAGPASEDGVGWLGFFRDLTVRGLIGVRLVTSARAGLVAAAAATLPDAAWRRSSVNLRGGGIH